MSELVAIAYPDEDAVERARENLSTAASEGAVEAEDVVVMVRQQDGTFDVRQGSTGVGKAATGGAMLGGAIGMIFLAPLLGMAIGALSGGAAWKGVIGDPGVAQGFVDDLQEQLSPGRAALVVLLRQMPSDDWLRTLQEPGHVLQTTLSPAAEQRLDEALAAARQDRPG